MAKLIFMKDDITKEERHIAKNSFVFPQFYGDYYKNCASVIWKTANDDLLKKFKNYQQFENHIKDIEYEFWNRKFVEYNEWKTDIWNFYLKKGFVKLYTGFICTGYMNKKQVTNYPIQGSAFHCLLWSLIELQKFIKENKLNSLIVGQIHDSMIVDVDVNELEELSNVIYTIMTKKIREYWDWIIVPLDVEMKVSDIGGNWFDMKEFKIIKK
jgi:DNA polymerase I-like protein with 3'-5' exonuclease and polymerase domains